MNLDPTAEQRELITAARSFVAAEMPLSDLEQYADSRPPNGANVAWQKMAELGWFGIGFPAGAGGAGGSLADQALLFRELGRALAPGPVLGTALGTWVAIAGGRPDLAAALMAGDVTAALAEPWRDPAAVVARRSGVSGTFRVLDAGAGGLVCVLAPDGAALLDASSVMAGGRHLPAPDPSVPVVLAELAGAPAELVLASVDQASVLAARGQVLAAALLVGILEAVRDLSVAYVSEREQFGKPVGSFQAVKHRCADMAVRAEAAGSLLWLAALSAEDDDIDHVEAHRLAASVKALASEYSVSSAHDNVQNHGGMGFTAECSAHLYVKRALEWSATLGSPERLFWEVAR